MSVIKKKKCNLVKKKGQLAQKAGVFFFCQKVIFQDQISPCTCSSCLQCVCKVSDLILRTSTEMGKIHQKIQLMMCKNKNFDFRFISVTTWT